MDTRHRSSKLRLSEKARVKLTAYTLTVTLVNEPETRQGTPYNNTHLINNEFNTR